MNHIEVKNLTKQYNNHLALNNLSLAIPRNSIFGLLGPNGAGKTSLIRIITQILQPSAGEVLFNNEPLQPKHLNAIGYLPEERGLYRKMFVKEHLIYIANLREIPKQEALEKIDFWIDRFNLQKWEKAEIGSLSKGMQQKVQFIATILHDPELIILDEPFSGFDPVNQQLLTDEIKRLHSLGKTIVFSTHRMESVEEICSHIAFIHKANCVLKGELNDIKATYDTGISTITTIQNGKPTTQEIPFGEVKSFIGALQENIDVVSVKKKEVSIKELFISLVNEKD